MALHGIFRDCVYSCTSFRQFSSTLNHVYVPRAPPIIHVRYFHLCPVNPCSFSLRSTNFVEIVFLVEVDGSFHAKRLELPRSSGSFHEINGSILFHWLRDQLPFIDFHLLPQSLHVDARAPRASLWPYMGAGGTLIPSICRVWLKDGDTSTRTWQSF